MGVVKNAFKGSRLDIRWGLKTIYFLCATFHGFLRVDCQTESASEPFRVRIGWGLASIIIFHFFNILLKGTHCAAPSAGKSSLRLTAKKPASSR